MHKCRAQHRTERTFLGCAIPRAAWIVGHGPYALIAWCSVPTISLFEALDAAESKKSFIDATRCGGRCANHHEIVRVDLGGAA